MPVTGAVAGAPVAAALYTTAPPAPKITTNSAGRSEFITPAGVKVSVPQGQLSVKGREAVADNGTRVRGDVVKSPDGTRVNLAKQGTSPQAGELKNLAGSHPQDALARVPQNWPTKVNIGDTARRQIDVKIISRNPNPATGQPVEVRIHSKDPKVNYPGANARNHWTARLQMDKDKTQFLADDGRTIVGIKANEGHIPLSGKAPAGATGKAAGEVLRAGGKVIVAAGLAYDAYKIQNAYKSDGNQVGPATVKETSTVAGGWLGGIAGAALTGAAVGSLVPGAGTVVGLVAGLVGGVAGAIGGSIAGEMAGKELAQSVR